MSLKGKPERATDQNKSGNSLQLPEYFLGANVDVFVLAISGGADSICLLHLAARSIPKERLVVANYDHGTGKFATEAAAFVRQEADRLGLKFLGDRARIVGRTEAEWRSQRWEFLQKIANQIEMQGNGEVQSRYESESQREGTFHQKRTSDVKTSVAIVTAHSRDDQLETIFMRILRGSGARGLVGLQYETSRGDELTSVRIMRPMLNISRLEVLRYLDSIGAVFIEDPSNSTRKHLRNRVRLDILPAVRHADPDIDQFLLDIATRSAEVRDYMDDIADRIPITRSSAASFQLPVQPLASYRIEELQAIWPAILAKIGIVMDRRGTERLAKFTISCETGKRIQLSGGISITRGRYSFGVSKTSNSAILRL